ncbi:MAG: alpha/beta hydrolase, partial [Elainellaceae cyanobacterium]
MRIPFLTVKAIAIGLGVAASVHILMGVALWRFQTRFIFHPSAALDATPANVQLAYEDVWLPVDGDQVHGWWIPARASAPAILYLHGNGSNLGDLVNRARRFHQWGYSVLMIDYRGYGRSSGPFPNEARVYADAEAAWDYLSQQVPANHIVVYGRSIGGAIAVELATHHPNAAGLILESSFTSMQAVVKQSPLGAIFPTQWLITQRFDSLSKVRS